MGEEVGDSHLQTGIAFCLRNLKGFGSRLLGSVFVILLAIDKVESPSSVSLSETELVSSGNISVGVLEVGLEFGVVGT